jgi:RNase P protein component
MIATSVKLCHKRAGASLPTPTSLPSSRFTVKRNSCRRRLRAAIHDAEVSMVRSGRMQQLLSRARGAGGSPLPLPM